MSTKSLDQKITRILSDPSCNDFIIADAKDADMGFGLAAPGQSPEHYGHEARYRSMQEYRDIIRSVIKQGLVDIMLMSASTNELLTIRERLFDGSHVTPAARANDTTDIWLAAGNRYVDEPSRPYRSATIDGIMCGKPNCTDEERKLGADLGLYSVTFNNDLDHDYTSLQAYHNFRVEAAQKGFRHFLEVFDPNACGAKCPADLPRFINDNIVRTLAGAAGAERPTFLKIAYHGPAAMEALVSYDRSLIVGILGGSSGTTYDAFYQLWEAKKYGARVALYGRMINNSEHQLTFISYLRRIADGEMKPEEAVRAYHADLEKSGIRPYRSLENDLQDTKRASAYSGTTTVSISGGKPRSSPTPAAATPTAGASSTTTSSADQSETADFAKMTPAQKIAWNRQKWNRILG